MDKKNPIMSAMYKYCPNEQKKSTKKDKAANK